MGDVVTFLLLQILEQFFIIVKNDFVISWALGTPLTNWTFVCFWGVVDNVDFLFFGTLVKSAVGNVSNVVDGVLIIVRNGGRVGIDN